MPPANRAGDQFDTLVVVRHKPVLEDSLKPSRLCRVSGRNGGQSIGAPQVIGLAGKGQYSSLRSIAAPSSALDQTVAVENRMHCADRRRVHIRIEPRRRNFFRRLLLPSESNTVEEVGHRKGPLRCQRGKMARAPLRIAGSVCLLGSLLYALQ